MLKKIIFSFFIFFLGWSQIPSVAAIYCFQCNSLYDPECEIIMPNDTSSTFYRPCDIPPEAGINEMFCRKIIQTIYDRDGMVRVIRRCGWVMYEKHDCYTLSNKGHQETICQCFSDGCNGAATYFKNPYLITISVLSLFYYFR